MLNRRHALTLAGGAALAGTLPASEPLRRAHAEPLQTWPNRFVRLVVPFPPGGGTDAIARVVSIKLSEIWGQQMVVENRSGAATNIGTEAVTRADPDGYTLLFQSMPLAVNRFLFRSLPYDALADLTPVSLLCEYPNIMAVPVISPAHSVTDFIAYANANKGKITFASSGHGTSVHLSGELFKIMTGIDLTHVPYRGSAPALTDMISGTVQVMFDNMPSSLPHIQAGTLRALGVTTAARSDALPNVPTVAETVPGYEASAFFGMSMPKGTPAEVIEKLNKEINAGLAPGREGKAC